MSKLDFVRSVSVIGCGGIGSWLMPPLFRFLSSENFKGDITLWDGDRYEMKNTNRQDFEEDQLGEYKAQAQADRLQYLFQKLNIRCRNDYVTDANVSQAVSEDSAVFTCVDNHPARARIDRQAEKLENVCIFSAGNEFYDGNTTVTLRLNGKYVTESLIARHPEVADTKKGDRADASCEELAEQGETQLLITNFMAAASSLAAFHVLWHKREGKDKRKVVIPQDVYFDISTASMSMVTA